jgi:hypothetical protein
MASAAAGGDLGAANRVGTLFQRAGRNGGAHGRKGGEDGGELHIDCGGFEKMYRARGKGVLPLLALEASRELKMLMEELFSGMDGPVYAVRDAFRRTLA